MAMTDDLIGEFEVHSEDGIRQYFSEGIDPNASHNGKPLFQTMVEMYYRSPAFKHCIKAFVDYGLQFDPVLLAILTDDAVTLDRMINNGEVDIHARYSLFDCAYTPLTEVSLLHICAEYNLPDCAKVLVRHKADVNAKAGVDEYGFGGHTPIFHTVNQNQNNSSEMMHFLLQHGADLGVQVKGLIWGKNYEWETFIPAVNPVSYAMMGLLPQMHRKELTISGTVSLLMKHAYGIDYEPVNVPCAYLR